MGNIYTAVRGYFYGGYNDLPEISHNEYSWLEYDKSYRSPSTCCTDVSREYHDIESYDRNHADIDVFIDINDRYHHRESTYRPSDKEDDASSVLNKKIR